MKKTVFSLLMLLLMLLFCACSDNKTDQIAVKPETLPESMQTEETLPPETTIPTEPADPFDFGDIHYTLELPIYEMVSYSMLETRYTFGEFVFNDEHQLVKKKNIERGYVYEYAYDAQGRIVRETETNPDIPQYSKTKELEYYEEAAPGVLIGSISSGIEWYGPIKNTRTTTTRGTTKTSGVTRWNATFDDHHRPVKYVAVGNTGHKDRTEYTFSYNDLSQITKVKSNSYFDGELGSVTEIKYTYDAAGRLVFEEYTNDGLSDTISHYLDTYEYDVVSTYKVSSETNPMLRTTDNWISFEEALRIPMPDSCVESIVLLDKVENGNSKTYTYVLPEVQYPERGCEAYYMYQEILETVCSLDCRRSDGDFLVYEDSALVAVIREGIDPEIGRYMRVILTTNNHFSADMEIPEFTLAQIDDMLQGVWVYSINDAGTAEYIRFADGKITCMMKIVGARGKSNPYYGTYQVHDGYISSYFRGTGKTIKTKYTWINGELKLQMYIDDGIDGGATRTYNKLGN